MRFQVPLYLHVISRFQPRVVSGHRSASLPRRFAAQERLAGIRFLLGEEPIHIELHAVTTERQHTDSCCYRQRASSRVHSRMAPTLPQVNALSLSLPSYLNCSSCLAVWCRTTTRGDRWPTSCNELDTIRKSQGHLSISRSFTICCTTDLHV